jgi:hypothetical protein
MRRNYLFIYPLNDKHQDYTDNTIPKRFIMVRKDSRPWITTSIKKLMRGKIESIKKQNIHIL